MVHRRKYYNIPDFTLKIQACHIKNCKFIGRISNMEYQYEAVRIGDGMANLMYRLPN